MRRIHPQTQLRAGQPSTAQFFAAIGLLLLLGAGCKKEPPLVIDVRVDLASPAAAADLAKPPALPVVSVPPQSGEEPTIELSGVVRIGPSGRPRYPVSVIVASGDCTSPSSRLLRRVPLSDTDSFFVVVMADPGEQLTVCAASEPSPGLPTPIWVKSDPITVGPASEQAVSNLSLVLRSAEPKTFSTAARKK
ncbi:MAG TPA: hypothetical protein PKL17_01055 [Pseudomonadota bacterium]|nr:hypothetical protein [Pseudomonadota bacterium]HNF97249.1 hypothetical protein [Pseudomonadota bacterium]HNK43338.1 hypothetical protein [Pseudomonadota bacterium]HNN52163.1 hypothetical protein [Pseudomonadota bacterium]